METIPLPSLPPRRPDSHKGDYGKVLVIAGSETMIGAPALVATAALRTGSGLVRIATAKDVLPHVIGLCPCATGYAINPRDLKGLLDFADQHDVVAVGPGLGQSPTVKRIVLELIERHVGPLVFDADAINALAGLEASEWPKRRDWSNVVLTPHMGEFMRLMGAVMKRSPLGSPQESTAQAQGLQSPGVKPKKLRSLVDDDDAPSTADGIPLDEPPTVEPAAENPAPAKPAAPGAPDNTALAELLAKATGAVVVLKGHRTIITDGQRFATNTTGNPGMATAGSGDVLTGVIASLIGQRFSPLEAAVLGVHVHGLAGDLAKDEIGPAGLLATDLAQRLPKALATRIAS